MFEAMTNRAGERLDSTFHPSESGSSRELVVIGHGVTANKDRTWAVALAEAVSAAGFPALRFSFAGNGDSEGRFEDSCPTKEAADLASVIDAAEAAGHRQVIYAGHSMGGAVGVMAAAVDPRIGALISLAGMVDTAGFAKRKFGEQFPGDLMWDKPECPLSKAFLDDMQQIGSVEAMSERIEVPWLLIHGREDTVVPFEDSVQVARRTPAPVELALVPGIDHVFSGAEAPLAARVLRWLELLDFRA